MKKTPTRRSTRRKQTRTRRATRRRRSTPRNVCNQCKDKVSAKIAINIREGRYVSRAQAIAVAFSQVQKDYPNCKRCLRRRRGGGGDGIEEKLTRCLSSMKDANLFFQAKKDFDATRRKSSPIERGLDYFDLYDKYCGPSKH